MSTPPLRFEPIALKLARVVPLDEFVPPDALDEISRSYREEPDHLPLPKHTQEFTTHYMVASRAAFMLLDAPDFARLGRLHELIQEEYTPGGPPMSPVYDSFAIQHVLAEVPIGVAGETPYSVLARLLSRDPKRQRFYEVARSLAESHLDLYRVKHATGLTGELEHARSGATLEVHTAGPFLRADDRLLARVLKFEDRNYISDSPYLLDASIQDWLDYFERVTADAPAPASKATNAKSKLTSKQKAKLKAKQRAATPGDAVVRHLRFGESERFWLDYVMDGYKGVRRGIVYLAAVPDRPELLPHSASYDASADSGDAQGDEANAALPPSFRLREALLAIAGKQRLTHQAHTLWSRLSDDTRRAFEPSERTLFDAYCTFGERNAEGLSALDLFLRHADDADADVKAQAAALKRGWFSVFRIDRVHLDQGLSVLDVLRRRKLEISEQSATRQVATGALLAGWLLEDEHGVLRFEGGIYHVPHLLAEHATALALDLRDEARRQLPGKDWRAQHALIPLQLMTGVRSIVEHFRVSLANTSGHDLQFATGRYKVLDHARVRAALGREYEPLSQGVWSWSDSEGRKLAMLALQGDKLLIRVNSVERLDAAKAHVERTLGDAVKPQFSSLDGAVEADVDPTRQRKRADIPAEMLPQLQTLLLSQIEAQFDNPLPMFKGKTLRQLARGKQSRADAISWLREQERILRQNPQFPNIDVRPLWRELGLEYQGLDTD